LEPNTRKEEAMKRPIQALVWMSLVLIIGCAHQVNITPPLNTLDGSAVKKIDKNVGYYIAPTELSKEVVTPGGGGDKIKYFPYKETEPALNKVLSNIFKNVYSIKSMDDKPFISSNNISYIFVPRIETDSSSESAFTWPPTKFVVALDCKANDGSGSIIWEKSIKGEGQATFDEFKHDLPLAAKRAVVKAFSNLQEEIIAAGVF